MSDSSELRGRVAVKVALGAAVVLAVLGIAYTADLLSSRGEVPRGVRVAGVEVGGLDTAAAEEKLRRELTPRSGQPVPVQAGDVSATLDPTTAGLSVDWSATLEQAGSQPLSPVTRVRSVVGTIDVGIVTTTDRAQLDRAVQGLRGQTDRPVAEGGVRFAGATPVAEAPRAGQQLDAAGAASALVDGWLDEPPVPLPVTRQEVSVSQAAVDSALAVARTAVATSVVVEGRGASAALRPDGIATVLSFEADGDGGLRPKVDVAGATRVLAPQLAKTETKPTDATVVLRDGAPRVVPSSDGVAIDWAQTLAGLEKVVVGERKPLQAVYAPKQASFTTAQAEGLGVKEVIGEFRSGGFSYASGVNIRQVAKEVTGAVVKPGETFSLNGHTGPRGTAQGYVDSGVIIDGHAGNAVGGGISQFATTLYNASYFAGMTDVAHTEHSYYISRYPAGREATVYEGAIDLKFSVPTSTGVLIEAFGDASSITVRLWGTKTVDVESINGGRSSDTDPKVIELPKGKDCAPSAGAKGFTTTDTRVVRDRTGKELSRKTRTVVYDPSPIVRCI
ncbi:VanW family protein [Rhodococcus sp. X156]|uniref:VanW family protein n=1 Tax=Rhodococcus sp. X156 TaxID=2499145 RepID=UPI000FDB0A3B|nr:VanW family protein [Rhodococcus sp. X156]